MVGTFLRGDAYAFFQALLSHLTTGLGRFAGTGVGRLIAGCLVLALLFFSAGLSAPTL
ncbi:hypothetical protein D3C81_1837070 [compost metagenome]